MRRKRRSGPLCPRCQTNRWRTVRKELHLFACRFCRLLVQTGEDGTPKPVTVPQ